MKTSHPVSLSDGANNLTSKRLCTSKSSNFVLVDLIAVSSIDDMLWGYNEFAGLASSGLKYTLLWF